jgi:PAS domain-containing protein
MNMKITELSPEIGICYIDLDGVIAFLNKGVAEYNNITTKDIDDAGWDSEYWHNVLETADIEKFFANLDWESNGRNLVNWFIHRNIPISFLTRPVKEPNTEACIRGKKIWLNKQGVGNIPVIFERVKEKYATWK